MYKVYKAVYGLKQSAKAWNDIKNKVLKEPGLNQNQNDRCLYTKIEEESM